MVPAFLPRDKLTRAGNTSQGRGDKDLGVVIGPAGAASRAHDTSEVVGWRVRVQNLARVGRGRGGGGWLVKPNVT